MTWPQRCCRNSLLVYGSHHVLYKQCSIAMRGQLGGDLPRDLFVARGGFRIIEEPTFLTEFRNPQLRTRLLFIPPQFSRTHTQEATNPKNLEKDGSMYHLIYQCIFLYHLKNGIVTPLYFRQTALKIRCKMVLIKKLTCDPEMLRENEERK